MNRFQLSRSLISALPLDLDGALLGLWRMVMDCGISRRVMSRELEIHHLRAIFTLMLGRVVGRIVGFIFPFRRGQRQFLCCRDYFCGAGPKSWSQAPVLAQYTFFEAKLSRQRGE